MISQREARRLRKRVRELEEIIAKQNRSWLREWPSSTIIGSLQAPEVTLAIVKTARSLGHAVVVVPEGSTLQFFASRLMSEVTA